MDQPVKRSKVRLKLGSKYYELRKKYYWNYSQADFASELSSGELSHEIFTHKTTHLRQLKDIDMWIQHNKVKNLEIAIQNLNGLIIKPGQTFSYWRQIGNPSKQKGYVEGMVLNNGNVETGTGGGLCQLSNLIYWMTLHTPLDVIERWRHAYDVFPDVRRTQPFGSGATCAYPNVDLQIMNNTNQRFQLKLELTDEYLVGKWLSDEEVKSKYEIYEKDHEFKSEFWGGYSRNNKIFRKVIDTPTKKVKADEFITSNHAVMMYEPLLESN